MRAAAKTLFLTGVLVLSTACPGESSEAPKPNDPATGERGVDTVPPSPPAPGNASGNPAPIGNDETADPSHPGRAQGAGAHEGHATPTTR
jgi:hypothetical protein